MYIVLSVIAAVAALLLLARCIIRVPRTEARVIIRHDGHTEVVGTGLHLVIPLRDRLLRVETVRHGRWCVSERIDTAMQMWKVPEMVVTTANGTRASVGMMLVIQITNPCLAVSVEGSMPSRLSDAAREAMTEAAASLHVSSLVNDKDGTEDAILAILQPKARRMGVTVAGVRYLAVTLLSVGVPTQNVNS